MESTGAPVEASRGGAGRTADEEDLAWAARLVGPLRIVSLVEATSYLMLLAATVVERTGGTEDGVTVMGPIHGVLYLVFAGLVLLARPAMAWTPVRTVLALVVGALPFGGFWLERNWIRVSPRAARVIGRSDLGPA